jgi:hypothetical protein
MLSELTIRKKQICSNIKDLDSIEYYELYSILKKHTDKITQNSNGIFINLKDLNNEILLEIENFIIHCTENKNKDIKYEKIISDKKKLLSESTSNETKNNYKLVTSENECINDNDISTFNLQNYLNKYSGTKDNVDNMDCISNVEDDISVLTEPELDEIDNFQNTEPEADDTQDSNENEIKIDVTKNKITFKYKQKKKNNTDYLVVDELLPDL